MAKRSAGILLYRRRGDGVELLLVHPGGPLWDRRDAGAWSIPKGEYGGGEDPLAAALREFEEETGHRLPGGGLVALLYLNHAEVREWPDEELAFVREVAERTRTAIARICAGISAARTATTPRAADSVSSSGRVPSHGSPTATGLLAWTRRTSASIARMRVSKSVSLATTSG